MKILPNCILVTFTKGHYSARTKTSNTKAKPGEVEYVLKGIPNEFLSLKKDCDRCKNGYCSCPLKLK